MDCKDSGKSGGGGAVVYHTYVYTAAIVHAWLWLFSSLTFPCLLSRRKRASLTKYQKVNMVSFCSLLLIKKLCVGYPLKWTGNIDSGLKHIQSRESQIQTYLYDPLMCSLTTKRKIFFVTVTMKVVLKTMRVDEISMEGMGNQSGIVSRANVSKQNPEPSVLNDAQMKQSPQIHLFLPLNIVFNFFY